MKKKNEAFTNFLDKKYIPLEPKYKVLLVLFIFALPAVAFYFFFLQSNQRQSYGQHLAQYLSEKELKKVKLLIEQKLTNKVISWPTSVAYLYSL